jgi:hypothetical protein
MEYCNKRLIYVRNEVLLIMPQFGLIPQNGGLSLGCNFSTLSTYCFSTVFYSWTLHFDRRKRHLIRDFISSEDRKGIWNAYEIWAWFHLQMKRRIHTKGWLHFIWPFEIWNDVFVSSDLRKGQMKPLDLFASQWKLIHHHVNELLKRISI